MTQARPTNFDLMRYADSELDAEQAQRVEAYLEEVPEARDVLATFDELSLRVTEHANDFAMSAGADAIADRVMAQLAAEATSNVRQLSVAQRAGRSSAGLAYVAVGFAAAAAVALAAWQLVQGGEERVAVVPHAVPPLASQLLVASAQVPGQDRDPDAPGVSVDAVDFGTNTGTIFYLPTGTGSTTTVVWLSDHESGGVE